jgi:hypothetical protein
MKTRIPCQIQHMRQWRRRQNTQPRMLFIACWKTWRRAWHGSIDSGKLEECCIGWCSETCRIEWTCGCRTKILRNRAKLLKAILIVSLAFPICAPGVFHALERTGWILKESPKFTMVNGWNEREKDVSHCKTRTEAGGAANSLLALAPWVEVGTRKSGAKSSWSSSHYVFTAQ